MAMPLPACRAVVAGRRVRREAPFAPLPPGLQPLPTWKTALRLFLFVLLLVASGRGVQAQTITGLSLSPASTPGGSYLSVYGLVTLNAPAPSGGLVVYFSSSNPSVAPAPTPITIPSGQTQGSFSVNPVAVSTQTLVTLTATASGAGTKTVTLTVNPPQVTGFWVSPDTLVGGSNVTGYLQLDGPVAAATTYNATSSNPQAVSILGASIHVPAGSSSCSFIVQTGTVNYPLTVTLTEQSSGISATLHLQPNNVLRLAGLLPGVVRLTWDAMPVSGYHLYRTVSPPSSSSTWTHLADPSSSTQTYDDAYAFVPGTAYAYVLTGDPAYSGAGGSPPPGYTAFGFQNSLYGALLVEPYFVSTTGNQTVDSRLDLRYATNVFLDHNFGATAFRGGLFVGAANDPGRVGRSFAKFPLDSQPTHTLSSFLLGNIAAYFTTAYTTGSQNTVQMQVGCQPLASSAWDPMALVWSNAPAVTPSAAASVADINYKATSPLPTWITWGMSDIVKAAVVNQTPLSVALTSQNEGATGWAYFAKKEFDQTKAPSANYAWTGPSLISLTLSPTSLNGTSISIATVNVTGLHPGDSVPLYMWYSSSATVSGSGPTSMTMTPINHSFVVTAGPLVTGGAGYVTVYASLYPLNQVPTGAPYRWVVSAVLTINGSGGGAGPVGPAGGDPPAGGGGTTPPGNGGGTMPPAGGGPG